MWPGIDPLIWKHVSRWLSSAIKSVNETINEMNIWQFGAIAAIVVFVGFCFMFSKKV